MTNSLRPFRAAKELVEAVEADEAAYGAVEQPRVFDITTAGDRRFKVKVTHVPEPVLRHGARATYTNHGCRCFDCSKANADYMRDYNNKGK